MANLNSRFELIPIHTLPGVFLVRFGYGSGVSQEVRVLGLVFRVQFDAWLEQGIQQEF